MAFGSKKEIAFLNANLYSISVSQIKPNTVLRTENLQVGYKRKKRDRIIASDIDLSICEGELIAVIGINGAGKSTLLKTLTKGLPELEGKVFLHHLPLDDYSHKELSEHISLVLTNQIISKNLSVFELVALGRQPYTNWLGRLSPQDYITVDQALDRVGLTALSNKKCNELSDGQLQKVMIARALAQDTSLIFMDEPTTHLDMYHKAYVLQLLKKLTNKTKKAIVFATHEINLALQLCDKIILINDQKVVQGKPEELIKKKAFDHLFPEEIIQFDHSTKRFLLKE